MIKHPTRRQWLRGATATAVAVSVPLPPARRLAAQGGGGPAGLFFYVHTPNGFYRPEFGGDGAGSSFALRSSLAPLEPRKSQITVLTGLCNKATTDTGGAAAITRALTCCSGPDPFTAYGPSIDHVIANHVDQRPITMTALIAGAQPWQTRHSWQRAYLCDGVVDDPVALWDALFAGYQGWLPENVGESQAVLDFVRADVRLAMARLSQRRAENKRLQAHLDALDRLGMSLPVETWPRCGGDMRFPRDAVVGLAGSADLGTRGRMKIDIAASALACGLRPAATLLWQGAGGGIDPNGGPDTHLALTRRTDAAGLAAWAAVDRWYAQQFAFLLQRLEALGILDRTIVCWGSEISQAPNQNNLTFVLAGGGALGFTHGRALHLPFSGVEAEGVTTALRPQNRSVSDLWVTIQNAVGISGATFGDAELCAGPITDLRPGAL